MHRKIEKEGIDNYIYDKDETEAESGFVDMEKPQSQSL